MRSKLLSSFAFIILLIGILFLLFSHFSLWCYFVLTALFLFLMTWLSSIECKTKNIPHYVAVLTYAGVALMSIMVFFNYFQAKDDIYSNVNHHALGWKGYQLPSSGVLYGRGIEAFLQDSAMVGSVRYELQRNDDGKVTAIHLTSRDTRRSFFTGKKGANDGVSSEYNNKNNTLPVLGDDGISFLNIADSTRLKLQIIEQPMTPEWYEPFELVRDSVFYVFTVTNRADSLLGSDTLRNSLLIQKSYEISALIPVRTVSLFGNNLSHFNIVREHYRTAENLYTLSNYGWLKRGLVKLANRCSIKKFESFRDLHKNHYLIEQTEADSNVAIIGNHGDEHTFETTLAPGDPFFIGFGNDGMPRMYFNEQGQLLFDLPQWRPLSDENDQTDILVSSSEYTICNPDEASSYNILFHAPQIDRSDNDSDNQENQGYQGNRHLFKTGISYAKGPTNELMCLRIRQDKVVGAGEDFLVDCNADDEAKAILHLTNFKSESVFQPWPFFRSILLIFLLASLSVLFSINRLKTEAVMPVVTEMACIVLLMVLFTTRYILCWRMSVFPPFEDISRLEYDSFVNNHEVHKYLTFWLILGLGFSLIIGKWVTHFWRIWQTKKRLEQDAEEEASIAASKQPSRLKTAWRRGRIWLPVIAFLEIVICMFLRRGMQILFPVAIYFLIDLLLTNIFIEKEPDEDHTHGGISYCFRFPFVLNFVVHLVILTMLDAGYGIMFLLYGVFHYYLVAFRYLQHNPKVLRRYLPKFLRRIRFILLWGFLLVAGLAIILTLFYNSTSIVAGLMNNAVWGNIAFVIILTFGVLLLAWGLDMTFARLHCFSKPINIVTTILVCLVLGWLIAVPRLHLYDKYLGPEGHYTHLRYRTKVLVEDWKDILNNERVSNARNVQRFRQTSENQWILDHYYNNRPQGEDPYFKMQPMSKTGAMWGAQTTDLSFLRFGIGEHGMLFAMGIFLLMLLVYAIALWQPKNALRPRTLARQSIAIDALLLILMQAIFVWMSVTNKFIFFGQDFPMLSMTSKMTIFYVLFLLVLAILFSVCHPKETESTPTFNKRDVNLSVLFTGLLALFCVYLYFWQGENRENRNVANYSLELNSVKKVLHEHNSLLRYYQLQSNQAYNFLALGRGRSGDGYNSYGKQLFADFNDNAYLNLDEEHENISSPDCIICIGEGNNKFPLVAEGSHLYKPLVDFYSQHRNRGSSAYLALNPDSVTLKLVFPQDSIYTPEERSLIREINYLFASFQIENRSLRLAELYVNRNGSMLKKSAKLENDSTFRENRRLLNSSDFTGMMLDYQAFLEHARSHQGEIQNTHLDSLLTHLDNVDRQEGATFTNSLIEAYINNYAKSNNPDNIIYMRRDRATGYLKFDINSNYFKIERGEEPWRGDILASDAETNNLLLTLKQGGQNTPITGNERHYEHFDLIRIPKSWLQGEKDQYIFQTFAPIALQLKTRRIPLPYQQWSTFRLSNADGASVIEANGTVSAKLPDDLHHVYAKNVWINGHRRHIYPLGKRLFWIKPYSNYVKGVMADSIKQYQQATAFSHIISLDYGLSDTLYQFVDSVGRAIYRNEANKYWREANLSVFVGNSDGEILAMPEFKGPPFFRVSPNDQESIAKVQRRANLFADYTDERNLNANLNLLPLAIGPGSSLKPLTFGAVSGSYATDWNNFLLVGSLRTLSVRRYADQDFREGEKPFTSLSSDEPPFDNTFNVTQYIYRSSNYYNSVITFIGSFSESSLQNGIFTPARNIQQYGTVEFPVMSVEGRRMKFSSVFHPSNVDAEPILKKRFLDNYGVYGEAMLLDSVYLNLNSLDPVLREYSRGLAIRKGSKKWLMPAEAWVVPEPSFLDFPLRANDEELSYAQKIKTVTLGMRRIVSITPLKMAEMYARMFLLDNHFRFTISRQEPYKTSVNYVVPAYNNRPEHYLAMLQDSQSLYQGMRRCAMWGGTEDGRTYENGTAFYLNRRQFNGWDYRDLYQQLSDRHLYIYAKTGTIDNHNVNKEFNNQANLLAVVITNADMRQVQIRNGRMVAPDGRLLKFYVIYLSFGSS